ncbi:MAG: bifunctional nuclease family protein [Verrucomicrobia bacterium]|nr:bifunctional nuclease family protein [Verrucomicrobiota bacterium]
MNNDVVPVEIRELFHTPNGCAIFLGNTDKVFVIQVEQMMGQVISMFLSGAPKDRPLTHDLMLSMFRGFNITLERVVINDLKNSTYFARLILQEQNELGRKIIEIDARPSDCLALAAALKRPLFVSAPLFAHLEDMTETLQRIKENAEGQEGPEGES